ncbi:MAG TPA: VWA domain-containing protein [Gemmataceae bacterium]|nr:VWA domain-containing protein [Gemmataceae bacterium]
MQTRHRVPTIFTLYLVDVLCCALGCVIFLWFLKIHEAKIQARRAERREQAAARTRDSLLQTTARLDNVSAAMATTKTRLEQVSRQMAATQKQLASAESEREQVRRDRNAALARLAALDKEIASLKTQKSAAEDELAKTRRDKGALATELVAARQRINTTEALLHKKEALAMSTARTADDLAERLRSADARVKELRPLAESVPGLREEARTYRDKLAALELRARALEKDISDRTTALAGAGKSLQALEETNRRLARELGAQGKQLSAAERSMETLRGEKQTLVDQVGRERAARENRFAGVALTGRRVVFLVDMSGSMEMVDEQTPAPEKWLGVRRTLAKVMRSLPDLEKFQVILFSDKITYLLGDGTVWLDYKGQASQDRVTRAMAAVTPEGSTNMSAALAAAFRFRQAGLDTIYLLSDGLPNVGEGLSAEDSRGMTETQRNETLSQYIRRRLLRGWNAKTSDGRPRVRINTIGFFFESPDVGAFLWALARENEGSFVGMSKP